MLAIVESANELKKRNGSKEESAISANAAAAPETSSNRLDRTIEDQ